MILRLGFAVVITHNGRSERSVAPLQPGNIAVHGEIFAVLVMALMADGMSNVVQQRRRFQYDPGVTGKMVQRLQLIEKLQTQFTHVLGMTLIELQPPRKTARSRKKLPRFGIVAMRFLPRKSF